MYFKKIIKIIIILFTMIGCSGNNDNTENELTVWNGYVQDYILPNVLNENRIYDYYEIVDNNIIHTTLNMDLLNVSRYFNIDDPSYSNELYEIKEQYNSINAALDTNKTIDAMIFYNYDTLTNITQKVIYEKYFGLYEVSKNICIINPTENNCTSYIYVRY